MLDGEIAAPDDRGVTHIDALSEAIAARRPEQFAYFAFDLLHLDGHDLRRCPVEDRKAILRDVIGAARCDRIVYVDHVAGIGRKLFEAAAPLNSACCVDRDYLAQPSGKGASYRAFSHNLYPTLPIQGAAANGG